MSTAAAASSPAWLELPDGRSFWLAGACAIGRQPDNDLVLDSPALSRRHALLAAEGDGFTISDLRSRNGTYVNGSAVARPVRLRDADEIKFGDVTLRFRCARRLQGMDTPNLASTVRVDQVHEKPCTLLLVDIAGSATLNQEMGSAGAHRRIQAWMSGLQPLIEQQGGRINGYLGDAIFAYWLPSSPGGPDAVLATLRAIEGWRPASPLPFRLVLHSGQALFTHSDRGEELTGHDVNFLFRSEKVAKAMGASAVLSESAVRALGLNAAPSLGRAAIEGLAGDFEFFRLPDGFVRA